jgi:hypothetical protein
VWSHTSTSPYVLMAWCLIKQGIRGFIQNFPDWPPGARTANGTALCHYVQLYRYIVSQSSEFCSHNTLCCFSVSVYCCCYFVIDSFRKLLDTPSYVFLACTYHRDNFIFTSEQNEYVTKDFRGCTNDIGKVAAVG